MAATTFDTLKAVGVPDKQAEAQASVLGEALAVNFKELATKDDLTAAKDDLMAAMALQRTELQSDLRQTEQRLNAKVDSLEQRLNAKIDNLAAKVDGQLTLLKWMVGLSISLSVAVLIRLFFIVRTP